MPIGGVYVLEMGFALNLNSTFAWFMLQNHRFDRQSCIIRKVCCFRPFVVSCNALWFWFGITLVAERQQSTLEHLKKLHAHYFLTQNHRQMNKNHVEQIARFSCTAMKVSPWMLYDVIRFCELWLNFDRPGLCTNCIQSQKT